MNSKHRLSNNNDFITIYKKGKSFANRYFVLYIHKHVNKQDPFRLGVSISKKVGNAVTRNYIKRRVKAVFIEEMAKIPDGYDFVIIARNTANTLDFHQTKAELVKLFKKSKVFRGL